MRTARIVIGLLLVGFAIVVFTGPYIVTTLLGWQPLLAVMVSLCVVVVVLLGFLATELVPARVTVDETLTIAAPVELVYRTTIDPRNHRRWTPAVRAVEELTGDPGVVGTRWHVTYEPGISYSVEVVAAEAPARHATRTRSSPARFRPPTTIDSERTYTVVPGGTEVHVRQVTRTVLLASWVVSLQRSRLHRLRSWSNDRLRAELEAATSAAAGEPAGG